MNSAGVQREMFGRRILVTGHTGFKGGWLCLWLHKLGAQVSGYALPPHTVPNLFSVARVRDVLDRHCEGDVRDSHRFAEVLTEVRPDIVFHMAAQALVRRSYANPLETFDINIMGTCSVLDAIRRAGRPCAVVVVTSDKCYEPRDDGQGHSEVDRMGGADPYSASKGAVELVVSSYRRSFFPVDRACEHRVKIATVRAGNVIGGGDWASDRLIPDVARSLAAGKPVQIRNPQHVRPWQHVLEPLSGYLSLACRLMGPEGAKACGAWNFGPTADAHVTVQELLEMYFRHYGEGSWVDSGLPGQPVETRILRLLTEKANSELAWMPRWTVDEAVARAAGWYRSFYGAPSASMRSTCLADIEAYEAC